MKTIKHGDRKITFGDVPELKIGEEMTVKLEYVGGTDAYKAVALDHEIIPFLAAAPEFFNKLKTLLHFSNLPTNRPLTSREISDIAKAQGEAMKLLEEFGGHTLEPIREAIQYCGEMIEIPEGWELVEEGGDVLPDMMFFGSITNKWQEESEFRVFNSIHDTPVIRKIEEDDKI